MGSKQSKLEGIYLSDVEIDNSEYFPTTPKKGKESLLTNFRKRLLKTMRNVTPTSRHQAPSNECSFNLDDTFANLLVEPRVLAVPLKEELKVNSCEAQSPESPAAQFKPIHAETPATCDPRSPTIGITRTPLVFDSSFEVTQEIEFETPTTAYQANFDPRSPTEGIVRTPIVFDEYDKIEQLDFDNVAPLAAQQPIDPRSPTEGIIRTPLVIAAQDNCNCEDNNDLSKSAQQIEEFILPLALTNESKAFIYNDDEHDEQNEEQTLEEIIEKIAQDMSLDSSVASFLSATETPKRTERATQQTVKLENKPLERIRNGKFKRRIVPRRPARNACTIYEDKENKENECKERNYKNNAVMVTPKKKLLDNNENSDGSPKVRTPLGCVKNRELKQSNSVESISKVRNSRIPVKRANGGLSRQLNLY